VTERKGAARRAAIGIIAALTVACAALPAAAAAQRAELERFIQTRVLSNGLEVMVIENHGVPLVTLEVVVKNGAFTQRVGTEGLAHLYEHMFFKANGDHPRPDGVMQRAGSLGAVFNAETHEEKVNYYLTIPSDSLEGGMRLLSSALQRPLFLPGELAAEKVVVMTVDAPEAGMPGADIAGFLARHGANAEVRTEVGDDSDAGEVIVRRAQDYDCDMIVMGAYGHSRLRELILGGATRHVLHHAPVPVLMSH
jgi:zinc protease